jgi:hypothetical protein
MPPANLQCTPDLAIYLTNPSTAYTPGSTIRGRVARRSHVVAPRATVFISLNGRSKVKLVVTRHNGNGTSRHTYRSRFNFFDARAQPGTHQRIHDGPIHIEPHAAEEESWDFAIRIPERMSASALQNGEKNSYLPTSPSAVGAMPLLDGPFEGRGSSFNKDFQAYIEYWLEASMTVQQGGNIKTQTASMPITIHSPKAPLSPGAMSLRRDSRMDTVSTPRLLPGMEPTSELTFKQKTAKFFGTGSVPNLVYNLEMTLPTVIQIGQTSTHIPVMIRVVPDHAKSSNVVRNSKSPPDFVLQSLDLKIKSTTTITAPGMLGAHTASDTRKHHLGLPLIGLRRKLETAKLIVPSRADETPLDIGDLLDLRVAEHAAMIGGRAGQMFDTLLYPTFTSFNIRHDHVLKGEVVLSVAGETRKHEIYMPITVLGAAVLGAAVLGAAVLGAAVQGQARRASAQPAAAPAEPSATIVDGEEIPPTYEDAKGKAPEKLPGYATPPAAVQAGPSTATAGDGLPAYEKAAET